MIRGTDVKYQLSKEDFSMIFGIIDTDKVFKRKIMLRKICQLLQDNGNTPIKHIHHSHFLKLTQEDIWSLNAKMKIKKCQFKIECTPPYSDFDNKEMRLCRA